jgi:nuclear pore complex protein Nup155
VDKSNFFPIVGISSIAASESQRLNLVAVSASGVRFFLTATGNNLNERPSTLSLQHIRLPPGFSASSPAGKPNRVHISYYKNGDCFVLFWSRHDYRYITFLY